LSERIGAEPTWLARRWSRLNGPQRIAGIDLARGLAVIGMVAAHLLWIEDFDLADSSTWIAVVDGRSSILFATLAGVSIGLVTGGTRPLPPPDMRLARERLAVRAALLWLIGLGLIATGVPVYVILPAYAILFLLALPLVGLGARTLFLLAGALALVMPFVQVILDELPFWRTPWGDFVSVAVGWHYPFPVWLAFVLAGLGVARAGILRTRVQLATVAVGATLAVIGYGADAATGAGPTSDVPAFERAVWTAEPHSSGLLEVVGSGGFALAVIGLCVLACRTILTWVVLPLRAVGAMPLTAYTAQLVVWAIAATLLLGEPGDLRGFRDADPFWPMTVGLVIGCTAWALLIGRGPLEELVDRVSRPSVRRG
jgi:uncharacterized membrane protein YeiB